MASVGDGLQSEATATSTQVTLAIDRRHTMRQMDLGQVETLARKHGIQFLLQFGSSVTGRLHARSDLDLAVLVEHMPPSFSAQADLRCDLQALAPDCEVDVAVDG